MNNYEKKHHDVFFRNPRLEQKLHTYGMELDWNGFDFNFITIAV